MSQTCKLTQIQQLRICKSKCTELIVVVVVIHIIDEFQFDFITTTLTLIFEEL